MSLPFGLFNQSLSIRLRQQLVWLLERVLFLLGLVLVPLASRSEPFDIVALVVAVAVAAADAVAVVVVVVVVVESAEVDAEAIADVVPALDALK